ncbi:uncharacterized protein LOC126996689 [Eriocheir sinensis]|uniref:uncharacterized protein LOC126996689 n=1 Tax=Eriocheir sinensis TaxID=95602 RepID=UPI0021C7C36B|nr:uncharacterized protein LOC126996689 [Eriocheir sinensis]
MQLLVLLSLVGAVFAAALPAEVPPPAEAPVPAEAPLPVEDTEEVAQARAEFDVAFKAAASAAEAGAVPEVVIPEGAPAPVEDTPEVAEAKAKFQAAFDAAALAAKNAPDFDVDGKISTYSGFLSAVDGRLSPFYTNTFPFGAYGLHAPIAPAVQAAPLTYTTSVVGGAPVVVGGAPVVQGAPASPIIYSGLGLPGYYGYPGMYGFPGTFALAAAPVAEAAAEEEPAAVEEA